MVSGRAEHETAGLEPVKVFQFLHGLFHQPFHLTHVLEQQPCRPR